MVRECVRIGHARILLSVLASAGMFCSLPAGFFLAVLAVQLGVEPAGVVLGAAPVLISGFFLGPYAWPDTTPSKGLLGALSACGGCLLGMLLAALLTFAAPDFTDAQKTATFAALPVYLLGSTGLIVVGQTKGGNLPVLWGSLAAASWLPLLIVTSAGS